MSLSRKPYLASVTRVGNVEDGTEENAFLCKFQNTISFEMSLMQWNPAEMRETAPENTMAAHVTGIPVPVSSESRS
jgi:hypothetical protein